MEEKIESREFCNLFFSNAPIHNFVHNQEKAGRLRVFVYCDDETLLHSLANSEVSKDDLWKFIFMLSQQNQDLLEKLVAAGQNRLPQSKRR